MHESQNYYGEWKEPQVEEYKLQDAIYTNHIKCKLIYRNKYVSVSSWYGVKKEHKKIWGLTDIFIVFIAAMV